ncbi:MAG TPA: DMT family transporter [Bryobacteraceae bacterium]|jgi:drug/metabolite transporter (DMT)-like permease|nr:DMT family transporter [Bryobacteraceae bacterium]
MAQKRAPARWQADLALALVALIWGVTFVVVKRALGEITTMYFLAIRFSLASLCLLLIFLPALRAAGSQAVWRGLKGGITAGVFLWLGYTLQTFGLRYTTAGKSGFLTGFYIVLVPLFGAVFFRRRPRLAEAAGILVASIGIALLTMPSIHGAFRMNRGDLLTIGCAVVYALHLLVLGHFSQRERVEPVALGQLACTAVLSVLSLPFDPPKAVWSAAVLFAIVLTAVLATAVAFAFQTWGQKHTTAERTALIFALEPVFAMAAAVTFGGERLTLGACAGCGLILAGILAVELKPARTA